MKRFLMFAVTTTLFCLPAFADGFLDPATLHTGYGPSCITGGCPAQGGEVNAFGGNTFDIYQNSSSATNLTNPWLLILGVPNSTNTTLFNNSSIMTVTSSAGGSTSWTFGNGGVSQYGWNGNGYAGSMTSSDVYSFLKVSGSGIDASNSFTNWSGFDKSYLGITANSFGIYVFDISAALAGGGDVTFTFKNGAIPVGTFVVGYGDDGSHVYVNPFTEAGLEKGTTPPVPEPASLLLFGTGLSGAAFAVRRRVKFPKA